LRRGGRRNIQWEFPARLASLRGTDQWVRPYMSIGRGRIFCMKLQVECYSGYRAEERPTLFRLDGREYRVEEVIDQWYGRDDAWYKVRAHDGNHYILRHQTSVPDGAWDLVSFRQAAG
jgi:hypothetical protein